jgi:hypothetical protein
MATKHFDGYAIDGRMTDQCGAIDKIRVGKGNRSIKGEPTQFMKNGVFWDVMPRGSCKNRRFEGT